MISLIPTIVGVTVLAFVLIHIVPGDPIVTALGPHATLAQIQTLRHQMQLDQPLVVQYLAYLQQLGTGNLGRSLYSGREVLNDLWDRWPATIELTTVSMLLVVLIGVPAGVVAAARRHGPVDHMVQLLSAVEVAMPIFWLGLGLMLIFSLWFGVLPVGGRLSAYTEPPHHITGMYTVDSLLTGNWQAFVDSLVHLILPAVTLSCSLLGGMIRVVRTSMIDILRDDCVRTARAKGVPERHVLIRHALRNAMTFSITVISVGYAQLLGGALLTETIFSWPGIGRYAVESVLHLDYQPIMGVVLMSAGVAIAVNLLADLLYVYVDPRIRLG